jgi:hypothetical protein
VVADQHPPEKAATTRSHYKQISAMTLSDLVQATPDRRRPDPQQPRIDPGLRAGRL